MRILPFAALVVAAVAQAASDDPDFPGAQRALAIKAGVARGVAVPRRVAIYEMPGSGRVSVRAQHQGRVAEGDVLFVVEAERLALAKQKRDAELEQSEVSRRRQTHENANQTREARNKLRELETNLALAEKRAKDDSLTDGLDAESKSYLKEANERTLSAMREQKGYLEGQVRLLEEAESKAAKVYDMTVKQAKFDWEAIEKASVVKAEFTGNALVVCRDNLDAQATGTFRAGTPMVVLQDLTQTDVVIEAVPQPWTELRPERLAVAPRLPSGQAPAAVFKESRPGKSEGDALRYVFSFPAGAELRSLHGKPLDFDIHYRLTAGNPAESPYQVLSKDALYRFDPKLDFSRLMKSFNERHKDAWIMLVEGHAEVALVSAARAKAPVSPSPAAP